MKFDDHERQRWVRSIRRRSNGTADLCARAVEWAADAWYISSERPPTPLDVLGSYHPSRRRRAVQLRARSGR